ncbi:hypothetical protein AALC25_06350 [Lachnospiraceae bacterium 29-84]
MGTIVRNHLGMHSVRNCLKRPSGRAGMQFLLAVLAAAAVKQVLVAGLPIYAIPTAVCDDQLMKKWAFQMVLNNWTGEFDAYTFMKEPGFSFFLSVIYRLHLPYIFSITLGYTIASIIFSTSLRKIFPSDKFVYVVYLVVLFNPLSFDLSTVQRVYRNGFAMILTLLVFGGIVHMYFSILGDKTWPYALWSCLTGISFGYLWITKSDTVWMLPFVLTVSVVMAGMLLAKRRDAKGVVRFLFLALPFLGMALFPRVVKACNIHYYGYENVGYYGAALHDMTHVEPEEEIDKVSLSRKTLEKLYEVSPTLASVRPKIEKAMDKHDEYDTHPGDGEVEDGWVGWALISGLSKAGVYRECSIANEFYQKVYEELEAAFADGRLRKVEVPAAQRYHVDTKEHRRELAAKTWEAISYMSTYQNAGPKAESSGKGGVGTRDFEQITRNHALYDHSGYDYFCTGWIVFHDIPLDTADVYVEDEEGNRYGKLDFTPSRSVYWNLKGTEAETEDAKRCRFRIGWDVGSDEPEDEPYYLAVYQGEEAKGRIRLLATGFGQESQLAFTGSLDTYLATRSYEKIKRRAEGTIARLSAIGGAYRILGPCIFILGLVAYAGLTVLLVSGLVRLYCQKRRKRRGNQIERIKRGEESEDPATCGAGVLAESASYTNAWLLATGFGLSIAVLALGIAVTDLTQCPAINEMYLSSGYAIFTSAGLVSMLKCVEYGVFRIRRKGKEGSYGL